MKRKRGKHPFEVRCIFNPIMKKWDVGAFVGGFASEDEARYAAGEIAAWLGKSGWVEPVRQPKEN